VYVLWSIKLLLSPDHYKYVPSIKACKKCAGDEEQQSLAHYPAPVLLR